MIRELSKCNISSKIDNGDYSSSKKFPTLRQLSIEYSASFATVRKAVSMLKDDGILISFPGHGTYLSSSQSNQPRMAKMMIGLGHLNSEQNIITEISNEWLSKDWLITPYNETKDNQDQELERKFIKGAYDGGFTGIILHPTPLGGANFELCCELRKLFTNPHDLVS